jgi:hypothetical protein
MNGASLYQHDLAHMPLIDHVPVTEEAVSYLVHHMREEDWAEIFALRWDDDADALAEDIMHYAGDMTRVWRVDGQPATILGAHPIRPNVWRCWGFGTEQWPLAVVSMTRHARRFIVPALLRGGVHRIEACAAASHVSARKWLESCGGVLEGTHYRMGRGGEDYVTYVYQAED